MRKISKLLLALSFVVSLTSSAFAVTVASWGGAYTESQKLGYGLSLIHISEPTRPR